MKFSHWIADQGGPGAVASRLGVTTHIVRIWLNGKGSPKVETIERIVELSGGKVSFEDVILESRRNVKTSRKAARGQKKGAKRSC